MSQSPLSYISGRLKLMFSEIEFREANKESPRVTITFLSLRVFGFFFFVSRGSESQMFSLSRAARKGLWVKAAASKAKVKEMCSCALPQKVVL